MRRLVLLCVAIPLALAACSGTETGSSPPATSTGPSQVTYPAANAPMTLTGTWTALATAPAVSGWGIHVPKHTWRLTITLTPCQGVNQPCGSGKWTTTHPKAMTAQVYRYIMKTATGFRFYANDTPGSFGSGPPVSRLFVLTPQPDGSLVATWGSFSLIGTTHLMPVAQ